MNNKVFFEPKVINEQSFNNIENQEELFILLDKLNKIVENHNDCYPNINEWLNKVKSDLKLGTRIIIIEWINNEIAGFCILKNAKEKKVCFLFVSENYQKVGVATKLFKKSFHYLNTNKLLFSINQKKLPMFKKIIENFEFEESCRYPNYYKQNETEISFNGLLF